MKQTNQTKKLDLFFFRNILKKMNELESEWVNTTSELPMSATELLGTVKELLRLSTLLNSTTESPENEPTVVPEILSPILLLQENEELRDKIAILDSQIQQSQEKIRENERTIWKHCEHIWVNDECSGQYDKSRYTCEKCKLWKNARIYNY